ncbi:hypothetical protein DPMN_011220 [Dreissena polymorpha]|uniref:Uncharacterized protein n=1 Tax=Dreissena polymorpha TaxID=45954 RepID=A0A9D4RZS8_DREPO|nr:hypothetical protein DPMN_011220 [Dreissena polymorpha]
MYLSTENMRDNDRLVNNYSVNSFITENNELTITRTFSDRKYSTLLFKPQDKNQVDIVITQGEIRDKDKCLFRTEHVTSGDIRRVNSCRAKCLVGLVFLLLALMLVIVIVCIVKSANSLKGDSRPPTSEDMEFGLNGTSFNSTGYNVTIKMNTFSSI